MQSRPVLLVAAAIAVAAVLGAAPAGASPPTCRAGQLHGRLSGSSGAAGTIVIGVTLTNAGAPCTLKGYAGLRLLDGSTPIPTRVLHGGLESLNRIPRLVLLAHDGAATILIAYGDVPTGYETRCRQSTAIRIRPPGQAGWLRMTAHAQACDHGTLRESPLLKGRRAP